MKKDLSAALDVCDLHNDKVVARIALNGYDIQAGSLMPSTGAMRSFVLLKGDLWDHWNAYAPLRLRSEAGQVVNIRIAALPVEDDGYGLIEFL